MRNHTMCGIYDEMSNQGFPAETIEAIKDSVDCNLYFFDNKVQLEAMYLVLGITVLVLILIYILMNVLKKSKRAK